MKMMSSTSVMSTRGVTLMPVIPSSSSVTWPAISGDPSVGARHVQAGGDGVAERLRPPDHALEEPLEDVEGEDRGDGDEEADGGGHQRLRDAEHHGRGARHRSGMRGQIGEGPDEAEQGEGKQPLLDHLTSPGSNAPTAFATRSAASCTASRCSMAVISLWKSADSASETSTCVAVPASNCARTSCSFSRA